MTQRVHKSIAIAAAVVLLLLCAAVGYIPILSVSANSADMYWEGKTDAGLSVIGEDCPLEVEHENITFTVDGFPSVSDGEEIGEQEQEKTYDRVTAEYSFYNPADYEVTARLAFPFGVLPWYYGDELFLDDEYYTVTVDGENVQRTLRHTSSYGSAFSAETDVARLRDDYVEDKFFTRDLPMTEYHYTFEGIEKNDKYAPYAAIKLPSKDTTRYMLSSCNGYTAGKGEFTVGLFVKEGQEVVLYVLGEQLETMPEWTVYSNGSQRKKIDGKGVLNPKIYTTPFENYAMYPYPQESDVSRVDWYNAVVDKMIASDNMMGYLGTTSVGDVTRNLMRWYEYTMTIPAGGRVINTVTVPLNPSVNAWYSPSVYEYEYLLSPAKGWANFGTLNITVNTPYYMISSRGFDFLKTESGYAVMLDGLPDDELRFSLSSAQYPILQGYGGGKNFIINFAPIFGMILAILVAAGLIVWQTVYWCRRASMKRNKPQDGSPDR